MADRDVTTEEHAGNVRDAVVLLNEEQWPVTVRGLLDAADRLLALEREVAEARERIAELEAAELRREKLMTGNWEESEKD